MAYNKYQVKEALEIDDIYEILMSLGAEPEIHGDYIISKTICHNPDGGGSRKLYYYASTQLFHCYTHCGSFDIFELLQKVKGFELSEAIYYVVNFFNLQWKIDATDDTDLAKDQQIIRHWQDLNELNVQSEKISLPEIDPHILDHYPRPRILNWEKDHITKDICDYMNICYNPEEGSILIPHLDEDGRLVGIRRRTLVQEEEKWGKYRPWRQGQRLYNHPLAFNLFGLYQAKENIQETKTAIVFEAEKSVLAAMGYLGLRNNIAVAVCGSNISKYQVDTLRRFGVEEICIAFDADFDQPGDEKYSRVVDKLRKINDRYNGWVRISFMFDPSGTFLHSKMSPTDAGEDIFNALWRTRFTLN